MPSASSSSIRRASSLASLAAWAGVRAPVAVNGATSAPGALEFFSDLAQRSTRDVRVSCRSSSLITREARPAPSAAKSAALVNSSRSSSPAAIGLILGSSSAAPFAASRNASCSARVVRRVGRYKVVSASCRGSGRGPPGTGRLPLTRASASAAQERLPSRSGIYAERAGIGSAGGLGPFPSSKNSHVQVLLGLRQRIRRADMHPRALHAHAVGAPRRDRRAPHGVEREGALRASLEQARVRERHAGECERHHLLLDLAPADAAVALEREIAAALVAEAVRGQRQQHQAVHARIVPGLRQPRQVGAHALDPHRVGVVDQEGAGPSRGRAFFTPPPVSSSVAALVGDLDGRALAAPLRCARSGRPCDAH